MVVGDLMLDSYFYGSCTRLSPEAPVPIVLVSSEQSCLGGACNVALNLRCLGCQVWISGFLGKDSSADICLDKLKENQINTDAVAFTGNAPTISKVRVIGNNQHLIRYDKETMFSKDDDHAALLSSLSRLKDIEFDAVVLSDYAKGTIDKSLIDSIRVLFPSARLFLDPKPANVVFYHDVFCITPNLVEARMMTADAGSPVEVVAQKLKEKINSGIVLITLSDKGLYLLSDSIKVHFDAHAISKKDTARGYRLDVAGAGDTLLAVFAALIISTKAEELAAYIANIAAGIVVNKLGTQAFTMLELEEEIIHDKEMVAKLWRVSG